MQTFELFSRRLLPILNTFLNLQTTNQTLDVTIKNLNTFAITRKCVYHTKIHHKMLKFTLIIFSFQFEKPI